MFNNHRLFALQCLLILVPVLFSACRKSEKVDNDPSLKLSFSTDTVFFDTVFPSVGSITQRLIVYNPNENKVVISSVRLFGGQNSSYRINIDGVPSLFEQNVEISGQDSLFIFVKVTIDPMNVNTPYVVTDSIGFTTNGNEQLVKLVAWGRDAIFYRNATLEGNHQWDSLKAHVIFGALRVDTASHLTILEGSRVYFHKDSYMAVSKDGSLKVRGTLDHPVTFQGDRMDPFYRDLPGQWGGLYLEKGSNGHEFDYAVIMNGVVGIFAEPALSTTSEMVVIDNTIIRNMTSTGIYGFGTSIRSVNCVIGDCGRSAIVVDYGGSYDFRQLTIANYWYSSVRRAASVYLSNYAYDTAGMKVASPLVKAYFGNSIIYGSNFEEIELDSLPGTPFVYTFDHALLRTEMTISTNPKFVQCQVNKDPLFVDIQKSDYRIDSLSPAINMGIPMGIPFDIRGNDRGETPDLGAYEWIKTGSR